MLQSMFLNLSWSTQPTPIGHTLIVFTNGFTRLMSGEYLGEKQRKVIRLSQVGEGRYRVGSSNRIG